MAKKASKSSKRPVCRKKPRKAAAAPRRSKKPRKASRPRTWQATAMGAVTSITYRHAVDGRVYRHNFRGNVRLAKVKGAHLLVLTPAQTTIVNGQLFLAG